MENAYQDATSMASEGSGPGIVLWMAVFLGIIGAGLGGTALYLTLTGQNGVAELNSSAARQGETLSALDKPSA